MSHMHLLQKILGNRAKRKIEHSEVIIPSGLHVTGNELNFYIFLF